MTSSALRCGNVWWRWVSSSISMNSNSSVVFDSCRAAAYEYHCLLKKVGSSEEEVGGGVGVWWVEECGRTCTAATQPQRRAPCAHTCCCGKKVGSSGDGSAEEWGDGGRRSAGELALLPLNRSAEPPEHTHAAAEQRIRFKRRGMITADADWFTQLGACFHPFCPPSAVQLCCVVNGRIR